MAESNLAGFGSVRDICSRLRPILGEQMEQVYAAYCQEDEAGKKQVEKYLELLAGRYLPVKLDDFARQLYPPLPQQAAGEYPLGMVHYADRQIGTFGLREDEWIQHVAVLGRSGAGKTNTGFIILDQLQQKQKPFLLFDWKRNYRDLLTLPQFRQLQIYTVGRAVSPFTFNPLIPPAGTDPRTWLKKLNEVIAHSYCLGNGVLYLLQQAVDGVYQQAGVYDGLVRQWPTFQDVLARARKMDTRGRESGWLSSTLRALSTLCFGDMDRILNTNHNQSIEHILAKPVILELDGLTQSDKVFFIQAMLLYIHHMRMAEGRREEFKHAIIIEEAHHVLSDERRSLVGGQSVMEILFREIREFGESLVLLDQHPSKLSLPALGNTYCTICLNLKHKSDINAMGQAMLLEKERDILGALEVGQAVVKLQGRIPRPFQVKIDRFDLAKGKVSDGQIQGHMQPAGMAQKTEKMGQKTPDEQVPAVNQPDRTVTPSRIADEPAQAFLADIRQYPHSGIAARYKRLGISVRQGQKLKDRLLQDGLLSQRREILPSGRLLILQLTEKGKQLLNP